MLQFFTSNFGIFVGVKPEVLFATRDTN